MDEYKISPRKQENAEIMPLPDNHVPLLVITLHEPVVAQGCGAPE